MKEPKKIFPAVRTEKEIETHDSDPMHGISMDDIILPHSHRRSASTNDSTSFPNIQDTERRHKWLQLSPDTSDSQWTSRSNRSRYTAGLDVPGAVRTIRTSNDINEPQLDSKLAVIMVGLPARGKSYLVKKLRRYMNWLQYETKIFNVGDVRRVCEANGSDQSASFFDPDNSEMSHIRDELAMKVLEQLITWLKNGGRVAIHDATNSTIARRKLLIERLQQEPEIKILLLESLCTDSKMLERNFRLKLSGPDYKNRDPAEALADFRSRVANYERAYQPVGDWEETMDLEYCKLINVGKKVVAYNISGYLSGQCIFYLMNFNLVERQIFLTRHGESEDNVLDRIGGDAPLTARGRKFSKALARFVKERRSVFAEGLASRLSKDEDELRPYGLVKDGSRSPEEELQATKEALSSSQFTIWTSMLKRTMETASSFDPDEYDIKHIRFLNEINSGIREGLSYDEIKRHYPDDFYARRANKLYYRYPGMGGESYIDVIHRLQSMIIELERMTHSCLIIAHRVVMRILLGYMLDWTQTEMPHMSVPIHTVYEIQTKPYGTELKKWAYNDEQDCFEEF